MQQIKKNKHWMKKCLRLKHQEIQFLIHVFLSICQYQCDQVSCEFMVNCMSKSCSTVNREKLNECKYIWIKGREVVNVNVSGNSQRARATNGKYGPVDWFENENDWEGLKEWLFSKWIPADFIPVVMTSFSNPFLHYDVIITEIRLFCWNEAKLACYFLKVHIRPNLWSNFCYYRLEMRFKINLRISHGFDRGVGQQKYWRW